MKPEHVDVICAAVDAAFEEQLAFTSELVAHPSTRSNEASAQDLMFDAFSARGLVMDRWALDDETLRSHVGYGPSTVDYSAMCNVVGTYEPALTTGRSLILNGHIDVVPEGPHEQWSRSPWDAPVIDGWLYGRGSGDMKAGLVANLFAFDAVRRAGLTPNAPIVFQSVVEEECTGNGSLSALQRGYTADAAITPEPVDELLARANVGVIWFSVRVEGTPTHPRAMSSGFNAIDAARHVMDQLRILEREWNDERFKHPYFEDLEHPINFNLGRINGGDWASSVPAWCEIEIRAAIYPGVSAADAWQEITQRVASISSDHNGEPITTRTRRTGFFAEGFVLEEGSDAEHVLGAAHGHVFKAPLGTVTTPSYEDARVFILYGGIPTLVYGPISKNIHGFDEAVNVESIRRVTKSIALFIAEWCNATPTRSERQ